MLTRRQLAFGLAAGAAFGMTRAAQSGFAEAQAKLSGKGPAAPRSTGRTVTDTFEIAERRMALPAFRGTALPLWTFKEGPVFPIVRMNIGDRFDARVLNRLPRPQEHVTIHWHGLRIANGEDGVPFMTEPPTYPGHDSRYTFTPPDTGTFFFHTHCNSVEHFGRGLIGAMIVAGDEVDPSDQDIVLMAKDWRIGPDGSFLPFYTDQGAAGSGTNGTVRSVNGETRPRIAVKSAANVRLRLLNVDPTRVSEFGIEGAPAYVIAVDGNACQPFELEGWRMGPAQRVDILMRSPANGETAKLVDYFAATPVVMAEFAAEGAPVRRGPLRPRPLRQNAIAPPLLSDAEDLVFSVSATATGESVGAFADELGIPIGPLCLSKSSFWAINKQSWASANHSNLPPPLATLKLGRTYRLRLENLTPRMHPIHIHGHTFDVLSSNVRPLPRHRADTVLLSPKERIEIAFVADNPGKWMFHCHLLEHQESGMMGHIVVA